MQKAQPICFLYFAKPKKKTKKKCFVDCFVLGVNQDIQIKGLLMYFFCQYEINEITEFLFVVYFLGLIT